jgi:acyl dehydratase
MALDYNTVMAFAALDQPFRYSDREVMLYALSIGFGRDPLDERELAFVYEKQLHAVPSFASVATPGAFKLHDIGINYSKLLHGEYSIELHRPLPPQAEILADVRVDGFWDKGADKGALLSMRADVRDRASGEPLYTARTGYFCRGDGGFLKLGEKEAAPAPAPHALPERAPDFVCEVPTRVDQALLYRLNGDRNPLHAEPALARAAGFERPILHGLCSYGVCCKAVLATLCDYDASRIRSLGLRFSKPIYPGETIAVELWRDADTISFRARAKERDVVVVNNGFCRLAS